MAESEGFLGRWSRLKQEARTVEADPPELLSDGDAYGEPAAVAEPALAPALAAAADPPEPPSLPPIESLGADSDYTGYLAPGVPQTLTVAALRKAWCSDPAIAGFRGFAEYDWDCNAPGYGQLLPTDDIAKLVGEFFRSEPSPPPELKPEPGVGEPSPADRMEEELPVAGMSYPGAQADGEEEIAGADPEGKPVQA